MSKSGSWRPTATVERLTLALIFLATAAMFAPTLAGHFLSDDFGYVFAIDSSRRDGLLLTHIAEMFARGLPVAADHYYRPLTYATFGLDDWLHGPSPFGWRLTNVLVHAATAAMIGGLMLRLSPSGQLPVRNIAALTAGLVFGWFPTSFEAGAWVSGRFDVLSAFFILVTMLVFTQSARARRWAILPYAAALLSKESGILALPYCALLALAIEQQALFDVPSRRAAVRRGMAMLAPMLAVTVAYFLLRWTLFGHPFQVYAGSSVTPGLLSGAWLSTFASLPDWFMAMTGNATAAGFLPLPLAISAGCALVAIFSRREPSLPLLIALLGTVAAVAIVGSSVGALSLDGRHGRLMYQPAIMASVFLGLSTLAAGVVWRSRTKFPAAAHASVVLALLWLIPVGVLGWQNSHAWRDAGMQTRQLMTRLVELHANAAAGEFALVLAPAWIERIPFMLNAQGAFVTPPFQDRPLSDKLIVQTDDEFASFTSKAADGLIYRLRNEPLLSIVKEPVKSGIPAEWPTQYWCWNTHSRSLLKMAAPAFVDRDRYAGDLAAAYATCAARRT